MTDYSGGWLSNGPIKNPGAAQRKLEQMKAEEQSNPTPQGLDSLDKVLNWWLTKLQVETVKVHPPVKITDVDVDNLEKAFNGLKAAIATHIDSEKTKARVDTINKLEQELDEHAKSIGLWGIEGLALDMLAMKGELSGEQKAERDAMVTERRAIVLLHGIAKSLKPTLEKGKDE